MWLTDGNYVEAEATLNRSAERLGEAVGRNTPDVAQSLENNAQLLRYSNRDAAASEMEAQAKDIRKELQPPAPKKPPASKPATTLILATTP